MQAIFSAVSSDVIGMFIGILNNLLLPKIFSVSGYGILKTFTLYIGYSGMLHLGYSDGLYVLLGGSKFSDLNKVEIKKYMSNVIKYVLIMELIIFCFNLYVKNMFVYLFLIYSLPFQIILFISLIYRATGYFRGYALLKKMNNLSLLFMLIISFVFKITPITYIYLQILSQLVIAIYGYVKINKELIQDNNKTLTNATPKLVIGIGFSVLLSNLISNLLITIDRWFVNINYPINEFSQYSFAASILSIFLVMISSFSNIAFPILAANDFRENIIKHIKNLLIVITTISYSSVFILDILIKWYLPEYIESLKVFNTLILAIPFMTLINIIIANLYKIKRETVTFTFISIMVLCVSIISNFIFVKYVNNYLYTPIITVISYLVWYIICSLRKSISLFSIKDLIFYIIMSFIYLMLLFFNVKNMLALTIFIPLGVMLSYLFYRKSFIFIVKNVRGGIQNDEKSQ